MFFLVGYNFAKKGGIGCKDKNSDIPDIVSHY